MNAKPHTPRTAAIKVFCSSSMRAVLDELATPAAARVMNAKGMEPV